MRPLTENAGLSERPLTGKQVILELKITKKLFNLPRAEKRNKELYIFEKGVFWSGPGRKSRVFRSGQSRKMGVVAVARHIPVLSLYGSTPGPAPSPARRTPKFNSLLTTNDKLLMLAKIKFTFS